MTRRILAVVAPPDAATGGFPTAELRRAMVEDVYEKVASTELVEPMLVLVGEDPTSALREIVWPGTLVLPTPRDASSGDILGELARLGADEAVLIAGDAPDLPALLIGKLYRGLGSADAAVLPARSAGLVALAARCPVPQWVLDCGAGLDVADALPRLQGAAPRRTSVSVGPGWHRIRRKEDLEFLDRGLEGWEITAGVLDQANGAPGGSGR